MTRPSIGIGVIGCGRIANAHVSAIRSLPEQTRLVAVFDPDQSRATALAQKSPGVRVEESLGGLLNHRDVDAVIVSSPNGCHADHTLRALDAGKNVLLEKPMAENAADAARMAQAADTSGRVLAIGQTLRHSDAVRYLQDHRQDFGKLRAVEVSMCVHWKGPQAPWWRTLTPEQGLILSLFAPHALDFVQLVVGSDAQTVHCEAGRFQSDWQGEDEAMILLRYPDSCLASVHVSYNQSFVVDRKTLHFEHALLRIENGDELWINGERVMGRAKLDESVHQMGRKDMGPLFTRQLQEFVAATRGEANRSVTHDQGLRLMSLLDRVRAAAVSGC